MISPDLALALLINRTGQAYNAGPPVYISYNEHTHVTSSIGRTQDINRSVFVRQADNFAVMKDLPNGGERVGQAFPIIPYLDPFSGFGYSWFANLKLVTISIQRFDVVFYPIPQPDPTVSMVIPYVSYWAPAYAPDSTEHALHLTIQSTARLPNGSPYPADVVVDPVTQLPSHIEIHVVGAGDIIALDYKVIDGHWTIVHAVYTSVQHVLMLGTFKVVADTHYDDITFPAAATDPLLSGTPTPKP